MRDANQHDSPSHTYRNNLNCLQQADEANRSFGKPGKSEELDSATGITRRL